MWDLENVASVLHILQYVLLFVFALYYVEQSRTICVAGTNQGCYLSPTVVTLVTCMGLGVTQNLKSYLQLCLFTAETRRSSSEESQAPRFTLLQTLLQRLRQSLFVRDGSLAAMIVQLLSDPCSTVGLLSVHGHECKW